MKTLAASLFLAAAAAHAATVFETARWIPPPAQAQGEALPVFRKEFPVAAPPREATFPWSASGTTTRS